MTGQTMPTRRAAMLGVTLALALAAAALWWATFKLGRPVCVDWVEDPQMIRAPYCGERGSFTRAHGGLMLAAMLTTAAAAGAALAATLTRRAGGDR